MTLTNVRCPQCGREDRLKARIEKEGDHYLVCSCGSQPLKSEAEKAFARTPLEELELATDALLSWSYDRRSRNPHHHTADRAKRERVRLAVQRVVEEHS